MPCRIGVEKKDSDLTIFDRPGGATVLALHPGRVLTFLDKAGLVQDQDTVWGAQGVDDPLGKDIACHLSIPAGTIQQVPHPIRGDISKPLGKIPAILSFALTEQSLEVG